jgi:hypothetical protein
MERERPVTPDQCKEYYTEMATFYMACAQRMDFDLSIMTKWFGHSEQELLELKKFLVLKSAKQDIGTVPMMSPSVKIEQMWNDFLKFPGLYHKFCYDLVIMKSQRNENGYTEITQYNIIDHVLLCDPVHTNATFNATLREYERFFEYSPPGEIWSNPFSSEEHRNVIASPQLVGIHSVASTEEMPSRSYNISKKRLGFLPKEEEEEDEIMKWSQQYDEDKKREMESLKVNESPNKSNDVKVKSPPRFGVKISSSSGGGKRGRSNSIAADEQSIRRTRSNSVTSVSSSEEVIANGKHAKDKKKKKLIVTKEPAIKKSNHKNNPNNGKIVAEENLYYCLENDTCVTICSSLTIDGGVDELIRLNSPYNWVKVTKKTKFKAGTALRINELVENPGAAQSK